MVRVVGEGHLELGLRARFHDQVIVLSGDEIAGQRNRGRPFVRVEPDIVGDGGRTVRRAEEDNVTRNGGGALDGHGLHLGDDGSAHPETDQGHHRAEMQDVRRVPRGGVGGDIAVLDPAGHRFLPHRDGDAEHWLLIRIP